MPKNRRHYRVTFGDALAAQKEGLKTGGMPGIKSYDLVQSAIARPYTGYYRSISQKAAALVESMATNHGFHDGNKRATLLLLNLFLRQSGYDFAVSGRRQLNDELEWLVLAVVGHHLEFDEIASWIGRRLKPLVR